MKIQAREIVREAKRQGLTLTRGGVGKENKACARAVLAKKHLGRAQKLYFTPELAKAIGVTSQDLQDLEDGFEGFTPDEGASRYHRVGRRVAELAGLS